MNKSIVFLIALFPILVFSQLNESVVNVEKQIQLCQSCLTDTNKFDDGSINILYNTLIGDSIIQKGYKSFDIINSKLTLLELVWRDSRVWYSFMFNSFGGVYMSSLTITGICKTVTYFYENGKIARIENYNPENCLDGWLIDFDENGLIKENTYYSNGKKSKKKLNKKPCDRN